MSIQESMTDISDEREREDLEDSQLDAADDCSSNQSKKKGKLKLSFKMAKGKE